MEERFQLKYRRVLEALPDVAECADRRLILVGGTALALFHLNHRISIDLDFVPNGGVDTKLKEDLKGCLTGKGYRTQRAAYANQFIIQFEDTSIKVEVFESDYKIKNAEEVGLGNSRILVASAGDILQMKLRSYVDRNEARDLFDIVFILKERGEGFDCIRGLIEKDGYPKNVDEVEGMAVRKEDYIFFRKVIGDAPKTSG
jgi:predicted nucleotidyltransferase component of viral defense system